MKPTFPQPVIFSLLVVTLLLHARSEAESVVNPVATVTPQCSTMETATVSITLNGSEATLTQIKSSLEVKKKQLEEFALSKGLTLKLQSTNQNISDRPIVNYQILGAPTAAPTTHAYTSNFSYHVTPGDQVHEFADFLIGKGYQVSVNLSSYQQCG